MTTVYLIRHAEAEGNVFRRIHGWYNSNVTVNGSRQIAALKERFLHETVDAVYASDLSRTVKTAEAIAAPRGLAVHTDARLREIHLGVWEDKPFGYLERFDAQNMRDFNASPRTWSVDGSEPFAQYTARFFAALTEIAGQNDGKTVAVSSHGCVIRAAQQLLSGSEEVPYCDNTAVSKLTFDNGRWSVAYLNDSTHLPDEISTFARQKWWRRDADRGDYNMWFSQTGDGAFCAMLENDAAGMLRFDAKTGEILELQLKNEFQNMALGPQLVGQLVSELRKAGRNKAFIRLPSGHRAAHFFAECGFVKAEDDTWALDVIVK